MSLTRKIVLNTVVNLAGQGASYLLGAVSVMLTMRYLGPELFGAYSLVMVYVGIIAAVAELGGQIILVREVNQRPAEVPKIIGNFLVLKLVLYALAFVVGLVLIWGLKYTGSTKLWLLLGLISMFLSFPLSAGAVFQARLNIWYGVAINITAKIVVLSAVLLMIWLKRGLELILWANIGISMASSLACWWMVHRWEKPDYRPDLGYLLELLRQSAPIGLLLVVGGMVFRSDVLLLSKMSDARSLGLYSAAYKYVEWGLLVTTGLLISHLPIFSQYLHSDPAKVRRLFRVSFDMIGLFLIPASLFTVLNSEQIIRLISGTEYTEGARALSVLILVVLLNSWNTMSTNMLIAGKKIGTLMLIYFPVMAANIAVNYFGIPRYGYMVCAFSSVLSEVLAIVPLLMLTGKWYQVSPDWAGAAKHLLLSGAAAGFMLLIPKESLLVRVPIFILAWAALGIATRVLDLERLKLLVNKVRSKI